MAGTTETANTEMTPETNHRGNREGGGPAARLAGLTETAKLGQWWKPKGANLLGVLYAVILIVEMPAWEAAWLLLPATVTIVGIGSFGHLLNDWHDADSDAAVGKPNRLATMPAWRRSALVGACLAVALLPWLVLPLDRLSIALLALELSLLIAYAVPPARLKERPIWAIAADGAYAYAVPTVLASYTVFLAAGRRLDLALLAGLVVWQQLLGMRHYLNHVALDRANDLETSTRTLATRRGGRFVHRLIVGRLLPVELLGFAAYLGVLGAHRPLLVVLVLGVVVASALLQLAVTGGRTTALLTYRFSDNRIDRLYQDSLPLILLGYLVVLDVRFAVVLLAHLLLFYSAEIVGFAGDRLSLAPARLLALPAKAATGLAARLVGALRAGGRQAPGDGPRKPRAASRIAIVNINKAKYTETFIQEPISALKYDIHYLHGGSLPILDHRDRHLFSNWTSLRSLAGFFEVALRREREYFLKRSIAGYLQSERIDLVLAHFGPVGVEMYPLTRDLGIALVVCFHGYDVYHRESLRRCGPEYPALFREARRIVGVSERMLARLEALGAPREKLVHLPAFVNLELFPYSDHGSIGPRFLAVGRFAETKSPHLTILAFHRVAQVVPEATLTLVGKGGGGELFEACVILAKALGLERRVQFRGVLGHAEVAREMSRARVFVQHSLTAPETGDMEGKPVAVMEAMASGLPVVATSHSGIAELIEDGVTGLLVEEYDVEAMAEAMIRLAGDDDLVTELGRRASAAIRSDPLISRHLEILEGLIDDCIAYG